MYDPAAKPLKVLVVCHEIPLIEYCKGEPFGPLAEMVIEPFETPQAVRGVAETVEIVGGTGAFSVKLVGQVCGQESSALRTRGVNVPAPRFEKVLFVNQLMPSIEYSSGAWPPLAEIVSEPFPDVQDVGWVEFALKIVGITGAGTLTEPDETTQPPFEFRTCTT